MNKLSISNCIHSLVSIVKNNYFKIWKYLLLYFILMIAVSALSFGLVALNEVLLYVGMAFVLTIIPGMIVAFSHTLLSIARSESVSIRRSLRVGFGEGMWWRAIMFFLVYLAGITGGMILLIIPGIYLVISWFPAIYYMCDGYGGPIDCLRQSRLAVKEAGFFRVLAYIVLLSIILMLMPMPFYFIPEFEYVGLIISLLLYPINIMLPVALYKSISKPE